MKQKTETSFILKHEIGKYIKFPISNVGWDLNSYFTDDPLEATRFFARELAESAVDRARNLDGHACRWTSELVIHEILSECTVKEIKVHIEFEIEE
jgi:hypothetical protein